MYMTKIQTLFLALISLLIFGGQAPLTLEMPPDSYVITLAPGQVSRVLYPRSYETIVIKAAGGFDLFHKSEIDDNWVVEQVDPATGMWMPVPVTGKGHEGGTCKNPCTFEYGDAARGTRPVGSNVGVGVGPVPGSSTYYLTPRIGKSGVVREIQIVAH